MQTTSKNTRDDTEVLDYAPPEKSSSSQTVKAAIVGIILAVFSIGALSMFLGFLDAAKDGYVGPGAWPLFWRDASPSLILGVISAFFAAYCIRLALRGGTQR